MRLINVKDIRYLQADQKYITVRDEHQEVIVDETLRELEEEFADIFIRVHRNALVARKHIVGLEKRRQWCNAFGQRARDSGDQPQALTGG